MFNALKYTKDLEETGFKRNQAEALVKIYMRLFEERFVTQEEFDKFRQEVYHRFERIEDRLDKMTLQLTIRLGIMQVVSIGLISTIMSIK